MSKMTSNSTWIPYQQLIVDRKLRSCVNFGKVSIQYPFHVSIVTSFYKSIKFEFSEVTMKTLIFDLNAWIKNSSEVELSELKKNKLEFIVSIDTVRNVSARTIKNFKKKFPSDYFTLKLDY